MRVGIIGLGYVGLPRAIAFAEEGHDPHVPELADLDLRSAELDEALGSCDLACVVTAHPEVDYERVVAEAPLVLNFRGVTRGIEAGNLVRL